MKHANVLPYFVTLTGAATALAVTLASFPHTSSHRVAVHPSYASAGVVVPHHAFVAFPIPHAVAVAGVVASHVAVHAYARDATADDGRDAMRERAERAQGDRARGATHGATHSDDDAVRDETISFVHPPDGVAMALATRAARAVDSRARSTRRRRARRAGRRRATRVARATTNADDDDDDGERDATRRDDGRVGRRAVTMGASATAVATAMALAPRATRAAGTMCGYFDEFGDGLAPAYAFSTPWSEGLVAERRGCAASVITKRRRRKKRRRFWRSATGRGCRTRT